MALKLSADPRSPSDFSKVLKILRIFYPFRGAYAPKAPSFFVFFISFRAWPAPIGFSRGGIVDVAQFA
jgi:hypothetical protein